MRESVDIRLPDAYGAMWVRVFVLVSVVVALVITAVTGVGAGIVLGATVMADTAGVAVATIVRARRHRESIRAAAAALLLTEHGRRQMEK